MGVSNFAYTSRGTARRVVADGGVAGRGVILRGEIDVAVDIVWADQTVVWEESPVVWTDPLALNWDDKLAIWGNSPTEWRQPNG